LDLKEEKELLEHKIDELEERKDKVQNDLDDKAYLEKRI